MWIANSCESVAKYWLGFRVKVRGQSPDTTMFIVVKVWI